MPSRRESVTLSAVWLSLFALLRAGAGLGIRVAAGRRFGLVGGDVDAYVAALRAPQIVGDFLVGGAFYFAVIPNLRYARERFGESAARALTLRVLLETAGVLAVAAAAYALFGGEVVRFVAPDLGARPHALAVGMAGLLAPAMILMGLTLIETGALQSHRRFFLAAAASLGPPLAALAALVWLAPGIGIRAWAWGLLAGFVLQALILGFGLWRAGLFKGGCSPPGECLRRTRRVALACAVSVVLARVQDITQGRLASGVDGGLASLNYAAGLVAVAMGLFALPVASAIFPLLSEYAASRQWALFRESASVAMRSGCFVLAPIVLVLVLHGRGLVALVFEGGRFGTADTLRLAPVLAWYAAGVFFTLLLGVVSRALYSINAIRRVVLVAAVRAVAAVVLNTLFFRAWSLVGLAAAAACVNGVGVAVGAVALARKGANPFTRTDAAAYGRMLASGLLAGGAGLLVTRGLSRAAVPSLAVTGAGLLVLPAVYLAAAWLLRCGELGLIASRLWRRGR